MNNFTKKQKIIIGSIVCIIIGLGLYFFYNKDEEFQIIENEANTEEKMENEENKVTKEIIKLGETKEIKDKDEREENISNNQIQEKIVVHVSGAVVNEGIVKLNENSRVSDAIEGAGGLKEDANLKDINLAYKLEDGMKIYIPNNDEQEEKENEKNNIQENFQTSNMNDYIITSGERQSEQILYNGSKELKVNINTATQTELETLPGIGPSTALKIINYRKENGNFTNIEAIKDVSGIGEAKFDNIKDFIVI